MHILSAILTYSLLAVAPPTWVPIPAGKVFIYGGDGIESNAEVRHIEARSMMRSEATVAQYALCVEQGGCEVPKSYALDNAYSRRFNYGAPGRTQHPVNGLSWRQAGSFCRWLGGRLPSRAEWVRAAQLDGGALRVLGRGWPTELLANVLTTGPRSARGAEARSGDVRTYPVGSFPLGKSPAGLDDMIGNLWEWTSSLGQGPRPGLAPENARQRIAVGASFETPASRAASWSTYTVTDTYQLDSIGVRCVRIPSDSAR